MKPGDTIYIRKRHGRDATYTVESVGRSYAHVGRMRCDLSSTVVLDRRGEVCGYWYESEHHYREKCRLEQLQDRFLRRFREGISKFTESQIIEAEKILFGEEARGE